MQSFNGPTDWNHNNESSVALKYTTSIQNGSTLTPYTKPAHDLAKYNISVTNHGHETTNETIGDLSMCSTRKLPPVIVMLLVNGSEASKVQQLQHQQRRQREGGGERKHSFRPQGTQTCKPHTNEGARMQ